MSMSTIYFQNDRTQVEVGGSLVNGAEFLINGG